MTDADVTEMIDFMNVHTGELTLQGIKRARRLLARRYAKRNHYMYMIYRPLVYTGD